MVSMHRSQRTGAVTWRTRRCSISRPLPTLPFNGKTVIGSREAMILDPQPKSMVIIGAGAIGVEFAYFYNAFGTRVTLIEMLLLRFWLVLIAAVLGTEKLKSGMFDTVPE